MNFYKYLRSMSFTEFCPGCLTFSILTWFSPKTAWLIETKLYVDSLWDENQNLRLGSGHVTKMAAMPKYGKSPLWLLLRTEGPLTLKIGIWHSGPTKFVQTMTLVWPCLIVSQGHIGTLRHFYRKRARRWIFTDLGPSSLRFSTF